MRRQQSVVIVPSRTIEKFHEPPAETQAYEERLLCLLLMLRDPEIRIVYVTSNAVAEPIVDYYLSLLPPGTDARERLTMLSPDDPSPRPLSAKLLERPTLLTRIRWAIPDHEDASLVPYVCTELEYELGHALGIPVNGADPALAHLGTKSGGRELFARAGVPTALGVEHVRTRADVILAIARLRRLKPRLGQVVVKLDAGVSGEGNALVELRGLPRPGARNELARIGERVEAMRLRAADVSLSDYFERLERGGVVEERIVGRELRSPSVQLELGPLEARIVSTHDQILSDDSCVGCRFPAARAYAAAITEAARRIGAVLVDAGAIGRAAIDFVVARDPDGSWRAYAIELNLRKGATTHPLAALELLSGGAYEPETAVFRAACGSVRHYVASDHVESPRLRALGAGGLLALPSLPRLGADGCGVVFHMLSSLDELGRMGMTAIGVSAVDAQARFDAAQALLLAASVEPEVAVVA
jgi:Pre ATP-grasp domain